MTKLLRGWASAAASSSALSLADKPKCATRGVTRLQPMNTGKKEMALPTTASEWMAELGAGELTPAHKRAFTEWLRESPVNVREVLELTMLRQDLDGVSLPG